jgi:hypothetical protein
MGMSTRQLAIAALKLEAEAYPEEKIISGRVSMTFQELRDKLEHDDVPEVIESAVVTPFIHNLQTDPEFRQRILELVNGRR